jgi:hypothetical protein
MAQLDLTPDERVAVELFIDDAIDGKESPYPLPLNKFPLQEKVPLAEARRLDSGQRRLITVGLFQRERLTQDQKSYLADMLIKVAGLTLAKAWRLTDNTPEQMLIRLKEYLR